MRQTRRDFFGIIAAPLLRRFTPPVPLAAPPLYGFATSYPVNFPGGCTLTVESLRAALATIERNYAAPFQPRVLIVAPGMEALAREVLNGR